MKEKDESKIVKKELENEILKILDEIKEKVLSGNADINILEEIVILSNVNDELADVLLNWSPNILDNRLGGYVK